MKRFVAISVLALAVPVVLSSAIAFGADPQKSPEAKKDKIAACMDMMQGPGVTEEGKKAMRDFMQSDRAAQAMANMMEMARRMGNGDVMLGMTKMMEMMGGSSGMMGGQGGMMQPGAPQPGK